MSDIEYYNQGIWTIFIPVSEAGQVAWNELAKVTEGTGKVFHTQRKVFINDLRDAGYCVKYRKPNRVTNKDIEEIYQQLNIE